MGIARTPPPTANDPPTVYAAGDTTLPTPALVFQPRNTRVARTPPPGLAASTSERPIPVYHAGPIVAPEPSVEMEEEMVEEDLVDSPPERGLPEPETVSTTPSGPVPTSVSVSVEPTTPSAKRARKSAPAPEPRPVSPSNPPVPFPDQDYGKRYQMTMETLELAINKGTQRWTVEDLKGCFPLVSMIRAEEVEEIYKDTCRSMKEGLLADAKASMEQRGAGPALLLIDQTVNEARMNDGDVARPNAWRPDLAPKALTAAAKLPIYDEAYARLRVEYLELQNDCAKRYTSLQKKQAELNALESGLADGVVDLDKTIELLNGFPTDEMMVWMEDMAPALEPRMEDVRV